VEETMTIESTASKVSVFALPQNELLTLNVNDIPMMKDALGPGINFQPLFLDPEIGVWSVLGTFAPGAELPIHLHTGGVHGYTLKGKWIYREYPDQPQTEGSAELLRQHRAGLGDTEPMFLQGL
jgi:hypothetical protein